MKGDFFMEKRNKDNQIKRLVAVAMFAALAYAVHFVHIPVGFLNLDFKDVIITVCGMYFGPIYGLALSVIVPVLEFMTASSTGVYGLIMNILSSAAFVGTASLIYRFKKTLSGAVVGLCSAVLAMTAVMIVANMYITPYYMGVSKSDVTALIPTLLLPFNAIKAVLNASLTLCLYKPITKMLKRSGFGKQPTADGQRESHVSNKTRTVLVWVIGGGVAVAALIVIFFVLGGRIAFN